MTNHAGCAVAAVVRRWEGGIAAAAAQCRTVTWLGAALASTQSLSCGP